MRLAGRPFSPCFTLVSRTFLPRSLTAGHHLAVHWASPFARPQAANQYNRTHLDPQQRATPTQCDIYGGLFGGFGGSGEGDRLIR